MALSRSAAAVHALPEFLKPTRVKHALKQLAGVFGDEEADLAELLTTVEAVARYRLLGGSPSCRNVAELAHHPEWFAHDSEPAAARRPHRAAPPVIIVDNFHEDPFAVRETALRARYRTYAPTWFSSLDEDRRHTSAHVNSPAITAKISAVTGCEPDDPNDEWKSEPVRNFFQYKIAEPLALASSIHTHQPDDIKDGWAGVVYLNPPSTYPSRSGVSVWREKRTGKCVAATKTHSSRIQDFDLVMRIENVFNRLVLFRGDVFHMGEAGFGTTGDNARLFETFSFEIKKS